MSREERELWKEAQGRAGFAGKNSDCGQTTSGSFQRGGLNRGKGQKNPPAFGGGGRCARLGRGGIASAGGEGAFAEPVPIVNQVEVHGIKGGGGIVGADGVEKGAVGFDGLVLELAAGLHDKKADGAVDDGQDFRHNQVSAATGDAGMKFLVSVHMGPPGQNGLLHLATEVFQLGHLFRGGVLGRLGGDGRLDKHTKFQKVAGELFLVTDEGEAQRVVRYAVLIGDKGAHAGADIQHIAGGQRADGLSQGAAAHLQEEGQLPLVGDALSVGKALVGQVVDQLLHRALHGGGTVGLGLYGHANTPVFSNIA